MNKKILVSAELHSTSLPDYGEVVTLDISSKVSSISKVSEVKIVAAEIPYIADNIIADLNQPTLNIGGNPYTITVPVGYYTGAEILNELTTLFNAALVAAATTYVIIFNYYASIDRVIVTAIDTTGPTPAAFTIDNEVPPSPINGPLLTELIGFGTGSILGDGTATVPEPIGTATSIGALNVVMHRFLLITCDEAKGDQAVIMSIDTPTYDWHDGIVAKIQIPTDVDRGTVIPYNNAMAEWIALTKSLDSTAGIVTFRLARNRYRTFGQPQVQWAMTVLFS